MVNYINISCFVGSSRDSISTIEIVSSQISRKGNHTKISHCRTCVRSKRDVYRFTTQIITRKPNSVCHL